MRDRWYHAFGASPTESVTEAQLDRAAAMASSKHSMKKDTLPRTRRLLPRRRASACRGPSADSPQAVEKSCWSEELNATTRRGGQASGGDRAKTDWLWGAAQDPAAPHR